MSLDISHCGDNQSGVRGDYGCTQQIVASLNVDSYNTVQSHQTNNNLNNIDHVYYSISAVPMPHVDWMSLDFNIWISIIEYIATKDLLRFKRCSKVMYNICILPICWADREYEYTQYSDSQLSVNIWLKHITTALYHVEKISLSDTSLNDTGVQLLCRLPFLQSINIANTNVSDVGLNRIINTYTHLQAINIIETKVSNIGLKLLSCNRSLRSLAVSNSKLIDRRGWNCLADIKELTHLDITAVGTHKSTMAILSGIVTHDPPCSKLTRLSLHVQSNLELDLVRQFKNIMELQVEIYGQWIDQQSIDWNKFIHVSTIHCLSIPYTNLNDNDLQVIATNTTLKSLHVDLNNPSYTDIGVQYVSQMNQLTELSIAAINITDESIHSLRHMTNLTTLSISRGQHASHPLQLTDRSLQYITQIKQLSMLRIAGIDSFTDTGLLQLNECAKLRKLVIERCNKLTEFGLHCLRIHNQNLQCVNYTFTDLTIQPHKAHSVTQTETAADRMQIDHATNNT